MDNDTVEPDQKQELNDNNKKIDTEIDKKTDTETANPQASPQKEKKQTLLGPQPMLTAADEFLVDGLLPLPVRNKYPPVKGWQNLTTDHIQSMKIAWWTGEHPYCIALRTGENVACETHVWGLDVDAQGMDLWAQWASKYGEPDTLACTTPGGGKHYMFLVSPGLTVVTRASTLGPGIDTRGEGGIIIMPPSWYETTSGESYPDQRYEYIGYDTYPGIEAIHEAPGWLLDKLAEAEAEKERKRKENILPPPTKENIEEVTRHWLEYYLARAAMTNARNESGLYLAEQLRDSRVPYPIAEQTMRAYAESVPQPTEKEPYTLREALASLEQAYSRAAREPAGGIGQPLRTEEAEHIAELAGSQAEEQIDPDLPQKIKNILTSRGGIASERHDQAARTTVAWLNNHGRFVQGKDNSESYYLYTAEHRLRDMHSNAWWAWIYKLTGVNPAAETFSYTKAACEAAVELAPKTPIYRTAHYDQEKSTLYINQFDGHVIVFDGENIRQEQNGESVILDDPWAEPYEPDYSQPDAFERWATVHSEDSVRNALVLRVWELSTFFDTICPTRPVLVMYGPKGSGKSAALRLYMRLVYGEAGTVMGAPQKPDAFGAAAAASHIMPIDNMDTPQNWMRDKIALVTTGGEDQLRTLYTTNEVTRIRYNTWLAVTTRQPDTLRREDIADRLVILPVTRIPPEELEPEGMMLERAKRERNKWWGSLLIRLNAIVKAIRDEKLSGKARMRMADWESLGRLIARLQAQERMWDDAVTALIAAQGSIMIEEDAVANTLMDWLDEHPESYGQAYSVRALYETLSARYDGRLPSDWPRGEGVFGRRLKGIRDALGMYVDIESYVLHHRATYIFRPRHPQEES